MKKFLMALSVGLAAFSAQGALLQYGSVRGQLSKVDLYESANWEGATLYHLGAGLRRKKVFVINLKIYVAQMFSSQPEHFVRTDSNALDSLAQMDTVAIRLQFFRTVDAEDLKKAYFKALRANNVSMDSPEIQQLLTAAESAGEASKGKEFVFVGTRQNGAEHIFLQGTNGKIFEVVGGEGFIRDIFSMWLGQTTSKHGDALKAGLISTQ